MKTLFCRLRILLLLFSLLGSAHASIAQEITGVWFNEEKDAKIEIYKAKNAKYYGKIVWLKRPTDDNGQPRKDVHNPNKSLRESALKGLLILKDFKKDGDKTYDDGTIYDPKNGKTYSCVITVNSATQISVRGYVGISLLGRTTVWTKTTL